MVGHHLAGTGTETPWRFPGFRFCGDIYPIAPKIPNFSEKSLFSFTGAGPRELQIKQESECLSPAAG